MAQSRQAWVWDASDLTARKHWPAQEYWPDPRDPTRLERLWYLSNISIERDSYGAAMVHEEWKSTEVTRPKVHLMPKMLPKAKTPQPPKAPPPGIEASSGTSSASSMPAPRLDSLEQAQTLSVMAVSLQEAEAARGGGGGGSSMPAPGTLTDVPRADEEGEGARPVKRSRNA